MNKQKLFSSFSGGETSAYMARKLLDKCGHQYDIVFIFANTGEELEKSLEFVDYLDFRWGLKVVWVEAVVDPRHGHGIRHKVVNFHTAARNGEPFEAHIAKSGIPNANKPQCSDRLKALAIESYKKSIGLTGCLHAIGIRGDESGRKSKVAEQYNLVYPLCDWFPCDKTDVNIFWEDQPFRLEIESHEGNCETCWKKSDNKLRLIALEHPERFEFMARMEEKYEHVKPNDNGQRRTFFRRNRTAKDILNEASHLDARQLRAMLKIPPDEDSGCSESCEPYAQSDLFR